MSLQSDPHFVSLREDLLREMREFMLYGGAEDEEDPEYDPDFAVDYEESHILECGGILSAFLAEMDAAGENPGDAPLLACAEKAVLALNGLNARCNGQLIETDQREAICALLLGALSRGGYSGEAADPTEAWREW